MLKSLFHQVRIPVPAFGYWQPADSYPAASVAAETGSWAFFLFFSGVSPAAPVAWPVDLLHFYLSEPLQVSMLLTVQEEVLQLPGHFASGVHPWAFSLFCSVFVRAACEV